MTARQKVPVVVERVGGWPEDYFTVIRTTVVVRFNEWHPSPWRCQLCGRHEIPTCEHELAAVEAAAKQFHLNQLSNERK